MRNSVGDLRELMSRLNETERERAWIEIEEQLREFEGLTALSFPAKCLLTSERSNMNGCNLGAINDESPQSITRAGFPCLNGMVRTLVTLFLVTSYKPFS